MGDLIERLRDRASRFRGYVDGRGAASSELDEAADALEAANARISEFEAARIAYASEFPPDAEGLPDVGSIHANIRAMKKALTEIVEQEHIELMLDPTWAQRVAKAAIAKEGK